MDCGLRLAVGGESGLKVPGGERCLEGDLGLEGQGGEAASGHWPSTCVEICHIHGQHLARISGAECMVQQRIGQIDVSSLRSNILWVDTVDSERDVQSGELSSQQVSVDVNSVKELIGRRLTGSITQILPPLKPSGLVSRGKAG